MNRTSSSDEPQGSGRSVASMGSEVEVPWEVDETERQANSNRELDEIVEVDEEIGINLKDFPDALLGVIFAQLPVQKLIQLRCICKAWNNLLTVSDFLEKCLQLKSHPVPFYVWQADDSYAAYNPESSSWHRWSRSFIRTDGWVAAAVDGVLLLESHDGDDRSLHLVNPITKSEKKLTLASPIHDNFLSFIIGMVKDKKSESYKILAMNRGISDEMYLYAYQGRSSTLEDDEDEDGDEKDDSLQNFTIYTFDSKVGTWEFTCALERGKHQYFSCPACHNGSVYCLMSLDYGRNEPSRVVRLERGSYYILPALIPSSSSSSVPRHHLTFLHLFEMRGHLMVAGGRGDKGELHSVHVWQLDEEEKVWAELMTMPIGLVRCLSVRVELDLSSGYYVRSEANMLSVTSVSASGVVSVVMCDFTTGLWWLVPMPRPPYSIRPSKRNPRPRTFLFDPKFDVFV